MNKNTAGQKLTVFAFDTSTNLPKTGDAANLTAYVKKDAGAVTALTDTSATENDNTNAKGLYDFDLAQAETNADKLTFSAKSSTAGVLVIALPAVVYTRPANFSAFGIDTSGRALSRLSAVVNPTGGDLFVPLFDAGHIRFVNGLGTNDHYFTVALTAAERSTLATGINTTLTDAHGAGSWQQGEGGGGAAGNGNGDIAVDHNYDKDGSGNFDQLRIHVGGQGVDDAIIRAYVTAEGLSDANPPTTTTGSDGRWIAPLMLDAGDYTITVYNPQTRRTKNFTLEVSE